MSQVLSDDEIDAGFEKWAISPPPQEDWHYMNDAQQLSIAWSDGARFAESAILAKLADRLKDVERYSWVRDRATSSHVQQSTASGAHYPTTWHIVTGGSDTDLDAAIDAAIDAMKEKK